MGSGQSVPPRRLNPTVSLDPGPGPARGMNDFVFLQGMYDSGAGACFDILSVNDYMLWSGPTDHRLRPLNINFARPIYIRDIMVANGDADKAIWIGEMNSNAVPNNPAIADVGAYGQVTLEEQARYAPLAYERIQKEWPWVGVANFWFFKRPVDREKDQAMYYFRMAEPDFTPLPVYGAVKAYTAKLTPTLYPGTHQEDHWALTYEGAWEPGDTGADPIEGFHRTDEDGASLRFVFEGAQLTLVPGPGAADVVVQVDDQAPRRISLEGERVDLVKGWRDGRHAVALTAAKGGLSVDALVVRGPWRPGRGTILTLIGAAWVIGWVWMCVLRRR